MDEIFKGSHSSNFFSNRNGGREDDFLDHPVKPSLKPNDFSDFSKKSQVSTIGKSRVTSIRPKRPLQTSTAPVSSTTATSIAASKPAKKVTQHSYYNTDFYDYAQYKSTSPASQVFSSTAATTPTPVQGQNNANRFNIGSNDLQTQIKIQPTTYNPNRYKPTTTKYTEFKREKGEAISHNKHLGLTKKVQKFEQTQQKLSVQNSTFAKLNEFNEFAKIKPQPPQPFQPQPPAKTFEAPVRSALEPQYYRARARVNNQQPEPFRAPQRQSVKTTEKYKENPTVAAKTESKPRGFVSRGSINYKATTQRDSETYPTTTSNSHKKFSTLVPKDKYAPTTFKPSTYKKSYENSFYQAQQTVRPSNQQQKFPSTSTSTTVYTTPNPYYNADEDDGQYHPELYEIDYSRSNFNRQRQTSSPTTSTTSTSTTTTRKPYKQDFNNPANHLKSQQQTSLLKEQTASDLSDEDELFKTAQSLNFGAASINKLRADIFKAEKTSQQYNSQYNPHNSVTSPKTTTPSTPFTTSTAYYTYPSYSSTTQTTSRPTTFSVPPTTTTTTTTTTKRPPTTTTKYTTAYPHNVTKSGKYASEKVEKKSKKNENKTKKKTSKRPPHADQDTSYDYAYYDSDTLSETPQEYPEYEIQEFTKTRRN